jgi:hypothetical protein
MSIVPRGMTVTEAIGSIGQVIPIPKIPATDRASKINSHPIKEQ